MELKQLEYFRVVADMQSFTKAASILFVTQPALSRTIRRLEDDLGYPLFERRNAKIFLTEQGEAFLVAVNQIFSILESSVEQGRQLSGLSKQVISVISSTESFGDDILLSFARQYPTIQLQLTLSSQRDALNQLLIGRYNYALIPKSTVFSQELRWDPLFHEEFVLMVHESHPLFERKQIPIGEISKYKLVLNEIELDPSAVEATCMMHNVTPNITFASNASLQRLHIQELTGALQLIPVSGIIRTKAHMNAFTARGGRSTAILRLEPPIFNKHMGIAYPRDRSISQPVKVFLNIVKSYYADLASEIESYMNTQFE